MNIYIHTQLNQDLSDRIIRSIGQEHKIDFRKNATTDTGPSDAFRHADAILGNPPLSWFENIKTDQLKFWQLDSAGFDQYRSVNIDARVANMGDWFAWPCAETIIAGVLALYRGLNELIVLQREKQWIGAALREELHLLHRKEVIILGAGTIALAVRSIVNGFGASAKLVARTSPEAAIHTREELLKVLPKTDLVINTLPGAAGQYVDREFLESMKQGSIYANVGRGSTTDEEVLIELLESQKLSGAVLDVTEKEPLPSDSPLWKMRNVILTQHTGGGQANEDSGKADAFIENFSRFLRNDSLQNEVHLSRGY